MPTHYSGAPSQTPRALLKPGPAPREDYVCNLSGERFIDNTDSNILDLVAKIRPYQDNAVLCNEVNEKVVQHFVHCIESHGKHVQYLRFLQTIVHTESQFIRRCQDLVMQVCACLKWAFSIQMRTTTSLPGACQCWRRRPHILQWQGDIPPSAQFWSCLLIFLRRVLFD